MRENSAKRRLDYCCEDGWRCRCKHPGRARWVDYTEFTMPTRYDLRRLEEVGLNSSVPPGQLLYDGWLLRLMPGAAKRARSVNAVYPSTRPLAHKVRYCEQLYHGRDLPAIFRITPFSEPSGLDAELDRMGYIGFDRTAVEVAAIDPGMLRPPRAVEMALPQWVQAVGNLRGSPTAHRISHLQRLEGTLLRHRALAVEQDGNVVATGLALVEGGWAGLFDIVTAADVRRQGFGRMVVQALLHAAWGLGGRRAYLQVGDDNVAARNLYRQFGFAPHYHYWYRGRPGETS